MLGNSAMRPLFRDYEAKYLLASVLIALCVVGWTAWYEIAYVDSDSLADTIAAIGNGISVAVAAAILSLASWETLMVIARRINERRDKAIAEDRDRKWIDWVERKAQADKEGREFTEPSPADKATNPQN